MGNNEIKEESKNLESVIQDGLIWVVKWFENKNPFKMIGSVMNAWINISNWINKLINLINFDNTTSKDAILWLSYDLLWKDKYEEFKKNNKDKNIENILKELWKRIKWKVEFKEWILKDHIDLFKKDEKEQKEIIFEYYSKKWEFENKNWKNKLVYKDWNFDIDTKIHTDNYNIEFNKVLKWKDNNYKDIYLKLINKWLKKNKVEIIAQELKDEDKKNNNIYDSLYDEKYNNILDLNNRKVEELKTKLESKNNEVNLKRVILNAVVIPEFAENIYGNILLSAFSNMIMKKLVIKISKINWNILKDENYKIFKNICKYLVTKDESQKIFTEKFFEDLEDNLWKVPTILNLIKNKFKINNIFMYWFLILVFILFWNYIFLDNQYFEKILVFILWFLVLYFLYQFTSLSKLLISWFIASLIWLSLFSNFPNYLKSSILENSDQNKPQIILLNENNLLFTWSTSINENYYMWHIVDEIFEKYTKEKNIDFWFLNIKQKNKIKEDIINKYLWDKKADKLPVWFEVDMERIERVFISEVSK